jgi:hypothetical protein
MRTPIPCRQSVSVSAGRAADDPVLMVASLSGSRLPGPVVGHRTFDGEYAAVVISDNEVERFGGIISGHQHCARRPVFVSLRSAGPCAALLTKRGGV